MGVIVQECARLKSLSIGPLPPSVAAQRELLAAVGNLRHLSNIRITTYHGDLYLDAFAEAAPAFLKLDTLHVALTLNRHKATLRLPPCAITKLDLMLSHCMVEDFELIVGRLATQTLHLNLVVANKGDGTTDWTQPPYHTRFNTLLQPIVTRTQFFNLLVITNSRQADSHRLLHWPTRSGGVCLFVENTGSIYARFETCWWVGTPDACLRHVHVKLQALRDGGGGRKLMRGWARRGEGWTVVHAAILEAVCGEDIKLVWE